MFKTPYGEKERFISPSGEKIALEHREVIGKDGRRTLVKDREVNIYEKIQASAESCDIQNILRRAAEGDMSVLNKTVGNYIDVVDAPSSLAEAQQFVINAKAEFDRLDKDIRAKFDNNAEVYVANYGTEMWKDATGITAKIELEKQRATADKEWKTLQETAFKTIVEKGSIINE